MNLHWPRRTHSLLKQFTELLHNAFYKHYDPLRGLRSVGYSPPTTLHYDLRRR